MTVYQFPTSNSSAALRRFDNPRSVSACVQRRFALSTSLFFVQDTSELTGSLFGDRDKKCCVCFGLQGRERWLVEGVGGLGERALRVHLHTINNYNKITKNPFLTPYFLFLKPTHRKRKAKTKQKKNAFEKYYGECVRGWVGGN